MITNILKTILPCFVAQTLSLDIINNPGAALPVLAAVNFLSLTGNYTFDADQNRVMPFNLIQIQNTTLAVVGKTNIDLKVVQLSGIQWPGGIIPPDRDPVSIISINRSVLIASGVISAFGCITVLSVAWLLNSRQDEPAIKASSPFFMFIILVGCFLIFLSLPLMMLDRGNSSSIDVASLACRAFLFMFSLGIIIVFGALLAKSWRIHAIFRSDELSVSKLTDDVVLKWVIVLVFFDLVINILWSSIHPLVDTLSFSDPFTAQCGCQSESLYTWSAAAIGYKALVMITTCVIAFRIRQAPSKYNESKQIFAAVYQLAFIAVILVPLVLAVSNVQMAALAKLLGFTFATIATIVILFVPLFFAESTVSSVNSTLGLGTSTNSKKNSVKSITSRSTSARGTIMTILPGVTRDSQPSTNNDLSNVSKMELVGVASAIAENSLTIANEPSFVVDQTLAQSPSNEKVQQEHTKAYQELND
jgi:gamma-aminobutyric acid type B receptor